MAKNKRKQKTAKKVTQQKKWQWQPLACAGISIGIVLLVTLLSGAPNKKLVERKTNPAYLKQLQYRIAQYNPEVVLLGNSMLDEAVDQNAISKLLKKKTYKLIIPGSSSAHWYIMLKNIVIASDAKPKSVVIFFRDHYITNPTFRVTGDFKIRLDMVTVEEEPLLEHRSYLASLSKIEYFLTRNWRLFQKRSDLKKTTETKIKKTAATLIGHDPEKVNQVLDRIFDEKNLNPELLNTSQLKAETETKTDTYDFDKQLPKSFLPAILQLAKENNIKLSFVRIKRRRDTEKNKEPKKVVTYIEKLNKYLEKEKIPFIDYTNNQQLKIEHYGAGDHLSRQKGRPKFMKLFAEDFKKLPQ